MSADQEQNVQKIVVVQAAGKSMAVAIILAILFGSLGMMYATVMGGAAAYELIYRTGLKPGGDDLGRRTRRMQVTGATPSVQGSTAAAHPARLLLTAVPPAFEAWLRGRAAELGIEVSAVADPAAAEIGLADDIVLLQPTPDLVEAVPTPLLADHGVCALIGDGTGSWRARST